jgi:hypothetical protein
MQVLRLSARIISRTIRSRRQGGIALSNQQVETFWRKGWPYLRKLAADDGISVSEFLAERLALVELAKEYWRANVDHLHAQMNVRNAAIAALEALPPDAKMKTRQWDLVRIVVGAIGDMSMIVSYTQIAHELPLTVDPFAVYDAKAMETLFDGMEDVSLDMIIAEEKKEESADPAAPLVPEQEPAPVISPPLVPAEVHPFTLAELVRAGEVPQSGRTYAAVTPWKHRLQVEFGPGIIDLYSSSDSQIVQRLVRSVLTGRGDKAGLKTLFTVGKKIVELKTVMNGHKRIIGCLDGDHLYLIKLMDIKASIGTYARRIPADLCQ